MLVETSRLYVFFEFFSRRTALCQRLRILFQQFHGIVIRCRQFSPDVYHHRLTSGQLLRCILLTLRSQPAGVRPALQKAALLLSGPVQCETAIRKSPNQSPSLQPQDAAKVLLRAASCDANSAQSQSSAARQRACATACAGSHGASDQPN